ncbi:thioredoxin family protein [Aerococcaceae bacterium NML190073]|nr:thioredoxin family protein [Aerococcaceae bacterium NML190073]
MSKKWLSLALATIALAGCQYIPGLNQQQDSAVVETENKAEEVVDEVVEIAADTTYLNLDEAAKKEAYAALDRVKKSSDSSKTPLSYSQVKEITSQDEYTQFLIDSTKKPFVLFLGYDESAYSKAFAPKLNQLAKEMDVPIYYYNVRRRAQDSNFKQAMEFYKIDSVPYAFVLQDAKVKGKVNYDSTMAEIEQFLTEFKNIQ